jgi:hypothetical protein
MSEKQRQKKTSPLDAIKSKLKEGWFAILRTGKATDSAGNTHDFKSEDLDDIMSEYDAELDAAPLVKGHPKTDGPAEGWVEKLMRVGDYLLAKPKQVATAFREEVNAGRFGKVSVKLKGKKLIHVGFLGAAAPGVKGLGTVSLSEGEVADGVFIIEFSLPEEYCDIEIPADYRFESIGRFMRTMREREIEQNGVDAADKYYPQWWIDDLLRPRPAFKTSCSCGGCAACATAKYSEENPEPEEETDMSGTNKETKPTVTPATAPAAPQMTPEFAAQLESEKAENAKLRKQIEEGKAESRKKARAEFAEKFKEKILPGEREILFAALDALEEKGEVEFSEGGKTVKASLMDSFVAFLDKAVKPRVSTKEFATPERAVTRRTAPAGDGGKSARAHAAKVTKVMEAAKKDGREMSFSEASAKVQEEEAAEA